LKRRDLLKHVRAYGCDLHREGAKHSVYVNRELGKVSSIPRHKEINDFLARKICGDSEIPAPAKEGRRSL
jgi:mRNA interferase HicA